MLTLFDMAKHLVKDWGKLLANPKAVTEEEYRRRLAICETCPQRSKTSCGLCGCNLPLKAAMEAWTCDAGYWGDVEVPKPEAASTFEVDRKTGCVTGPRGIKGEEGRCPGWQTCTARMLKIVDNGREVELLPICTLDGRKMVSSDTCKTCTLARN